MIVRVGKFTASAVVMFLFMFSLIFCFDSSDTPTDILLVCANVWRERRSGFVKKRKKCYLCVL